MFGTKPPDRLERSARSIARALSRSWRPPARMWWDEELRPRFVPVNGRDVCYVEVGDGPPVLLVHGFAASSSVWAHQVRPLAQHFRVYALDLLGHGYSAKPDIDYSPGTYVDLLKGFLDSLGLSSASIAGHSMGGFIAICLATAAPERVRRLVLIASSSPLYRPKSMVRLHENLRKHPRRWRWLLALLEILVPFPSRRVERKGIRNSVYDPGCIGQEWVDHFYAIRRMKGFSRMVISTLMGLPQLSAYEDRVRDIELPVLLLWGEADRVVPVDHARLLRNTLPDARLEVIARCGHFPMVEQPEPTTRHMLAFLGASTTSPCPHR